MEAVDVVPVVSNMPETIYVDMEDGELIADANPGGFAPTDFAFTNFVAVYKLHGFVEVSVAVNRVEVAADAK